MPRSIRNNQPHEQNDLNTLQGYAAEKLRIALAPQPKALLDAESKAFIDAAAVAMQGCAAYSPGTCETLRAIFRGILRSQLELMV